MGVGRPASVQGKTYGNPERRILCMKTNYFEHVFSIALSLFPLAIILGLYLLIIKLIELSLSLIVNVY